MISKSDRFNLIRQASRKLGMVIVAPLPGLMAMSAPEVRDLVRGTVHRNIEQLDEEEAQMAPTLQFDSVPRGGHVDGILNLTEKQKLAREVDAYRWREGKRRNSWIVLA